MRPSHIARGLSHQEAANTLGISRNVLRKYLCVTPISVQTEKLIALLRQNQT
jgi:hypothetical protein